MIILKKIFGVRLKKLRELVSVTLCNNSHSFHISTKKGVIRYATNWLKFIFTPSYTTIPEFCADLLPDIYKVNVMDKDCTTDYIIDNSYSNYLLGRYDLTCMGSRFKFNTLRNLFRNMFRSDSYMVNHYAGKLTVPIIALLKRQFGDINFSDIMVPTRRTVMTIVKNFETGLYDHVRREISLVRAGPNAEPFLKLVA